MNRFLNYFLLYFIWLPLIGAAQTYHLPKGQKSEKLNFRIINNLVVVPIEVNGTELSFILDSGVSKPILFNLSDRDSVQINNVSEITIRGLGQGEPIKALISSGNSFRLKNVENNDQQLYVVLDKSMNLSPSLGIPIHGIIGYDIFRDFVVEVNYGSSTIRLHDPELYTYRNSKKQETLPLSIFKRKAYVDGHVFMENTNAQAVKLLLDTGNSDAVWLFEDAHIKIPEKNYEDFLGKGLNGDIFGRRTKITGLRLGNFILEDAKAAFPDKDSYGAIDNLGSRNGSLGGEVLKRFNIVFDYQKGKITFSKNRNFTSPFQYNLSGLDLRHDGVRYISESISDSRGIEKRRGEKFGDVQLLFETQTRLSLAPEIVVSGIRAGSPAHGAGLKEGDVILAVNGKRVYEYKLQEVMEMLNDREGKRIRLQIERSNSDMLFTFVLKNILK